MSVSTPVSVVITNYETASLAARCVEAIRRECTGVGEVIVVDDASVEDPAAALPKGITLLRNKENLGYVRSVNIGVAHAKGDVVLLLDSDASPLEDVSGVAARSFMRNPRLGALGFGLVDRDGHPTGATQPEPTALGLALGQALEARVSRYLSHASGGRFTIHSCAVAFRRDLFRQVGGFDEGFDFLDADTDFSMRLWRAGYELEIAKEVHILHEGSGSPQTTARRVLRHHANRWRLLEKHGLIPRPQLLKAVLAARHLAELTWLLGPGRLVKGEGAASGRRRDKISGRKQLLATVWRSYRR